MNPINLFKGYKKGEDKQTHSFLSFLNFLKETDKKTFLTFCYALNILNSKDGIRNLEISCFPKKEGTGRVDWDGQITTKTAITAIESKIKPSAFRPSQIKVHKKKLRGLKKYKNKKLILLTPFDKDWLIRKDTSLKNKYVNFLSWSDIYSEINNIPLDNKDNSFVFVLNEYKKYVNDINEDRAGIIQIINEDIFYTKQEYKRLVKGKLRKFHVPAKKFGFDIPNFKVFLYSKENGIFALFTSEGMFWDKSRKGEYDGEYEYYFKIKDFKELNNKINIQQIKLLLGNSNMGVDYKKFKNFKDKKCSTGYYILNKKMVDALINKKQSSS